MHIKKKLLKINDLILSGWNEEGQAKGPSLFQGKGLLEYA